MIQYTPLRSFFIFILDLFMLLSLLNISLCLEDLTTTQLIDILELAHVKYKTLKSYSHRSMLENSFYEDKAIDLQTMVSFMFVNMEA